MGDSTQETKSMPVRALCVALVATLAGCAASRQGEVAQTEGTPSPVVTVSRDAAPMPTETGPRRTGVYPTFAKPLTAANVQMSDAEAANIEGQMRALTAAKRAGNVSEAEYQRRLAELRKLAQQHGQDTLSEIAN